MAAMGAYVTAVEPAATLRALGAEATTTSVRWIDDRLPELSSLAGENGAFDLILCSAVIMYIGRNDLTHALVRLRELMSENGSLVISTKVAGPPLERCNYYSPEFLMAIARAVGLRCIGNRSMPDQLARVGVHWRTLIMRREGAELKSYFDALPADVP